MSRRSVGGDCREDYSVVWKDLPHWTQAGTLAFVAWRTTDLPLDHAAGDAVSAGEEFSQIVMNSLLHFDGDRYLQTDAVIMPNHVPLIAAFQSGAALLKQCTS